MSHFFGEYQPIIDSLFLGKTEWDSFPTFPLNTDGIDPAGSNVRIENVKITNWDDAIAVKPSHKTDKVAKDGCSQDISVQNMTVMFGIGATIGSVPPSDNHACVRRVHFKDAHFDYPVKAIYVKTNPGYSGSGEIRDIFYENININFPIWFGIYIGPQ
jgi:polygalacturonase